MGKAVALALAASGTSVHLVGRTSEKLECTAGEIRAHGGSASVFPADVSQEGSLDGLAAQLGRGLDILVNCAGEALMTPFAESTFGDWQRVIESNLTASLVATHAFLPALRKSANASIIIVTSKAALRSYPVAVYSAAKAGALGFAQALAVELRQDGVRVVALCPGPTSTPMRRDSTPEMSADLIIRPEVIADTVMFLVSLPPGVTSGAIVVESALND